jgi:hypothetical protein
MARYTTSDHNHGNSKEFPTLIEALEAAAEDAAVCFVDQGDVTHMKDNVILPTAQREMTTAQKNWAYHIGYVFGL